MLRIKNKPKILYYIYYSLALMLETIEYIPNWQIETSLQLIFVVDNLRIFAWCQPLSITLESMENVLQHFRQICCCCCTLLVLFLYDLRRAAPAQPRALPVLEQEPQAGAQGYNKVESSHTLLPFSPIPIRSSSVPLISSPVPIRSSSVPLISSPVPFRSLFPLIPSQYKIIVFSYSIFSNQWRWKC